MGDQKEERIEEKRGEKKTKIAKQPEIHIAKEKKKKKKKKNNNNNKDNSEEKSKEAGNGNPKTKESGEHKDKEKERNDVDVTKVEQKQSNHNNGNNKKRKRKDVFPYGNYRNYYGYRIGQEMDEDPRLKVMRKEWFLGKDCLDVGCNSGIITINIAQKFQCQSILGVDIDSERIEDAYWHLRKLVREVNARKTGAKTSKLEAPEKVQSSNYNAPAASVEKEIARPGVPPEERDLLDIVSFKRENFVQSWHPPEKRYDTVLCLSVTKWVHLNWGDEGLMSLFSKIWRLLNPGGILILEPQPWKSYQSNRAVSETTAKNFREIMFHPESFEEILLDKIGFRSVEDITSNLSGSKTGFDVECSVTGECGHGYSVAKDSKPLLNEVNTRFFGEASKRLSDEINI